MTLRFQYLLHDTSIDLGENIPKTILSLRRVQRLFTPLSTDLTANQLPGFPYN